ncbi:hypothetical protein F5Y18DRAFT_442884 [Xylariaceae sp. FL1019]|nr:hypothetical protein F5Y18DRAFT_442884 [Xylariaceae sp. FL1019]
MWEYPLLDYHNNYTKLPLHYKHYTKLPRHYHNCINLPVYNDDSKHDGFEHDDDGSNHDDSFKYNYSKYNYPKYNYPNTTSSSTTTTTSTAAPTPTLVACDPSAAGMNTYGAGGCDDDCACNGDTSSMAFCATTEGSGMQCASDDGCPAGEFCDQNPQEDDAYTPICQNSLKSDGTQCSSTYTQIGFALRGIGLLQDDYGR